MKEARLGIRLPASLLKDAKAAARHRKVTLTVFVHRLIEEAVEADKKSRDIQTTIDAEQI